MSEAETEEQSDSADSGNICDPYNFEGERVGDIHRPGSSLHCNHCNYRFKNHKELSNHLQGLLKNAHPGQKRKGSANPESAQNKRRKIGKNSVKNNKDGNFNEVGNINNKRRGNDVKNVNSDADRQRKEPDHSLRDETLGEERGHKTRMVPETSEAELKILVDYLNKNPSQIRALIQLLNINNNASSYDSKMRSKLFRCRRCKIHMVKKREFRKHSHNDVKFKCGNCQLDFTRKSLQRHLKVHEEDGVTAENFNIIDYPDRSDAVSDSEDAMNMEFHAKDASDYIESKRTDSRNEPPLEDPSRDDPTLENNIADTNTVLRNHFLRKKYNSGKIPMYKCGVCNEVFLRIRILEEHVRNSEHFITKGKFVCPYCELQFGNKDTLKYHVKKHHEERCLTVNDFLIMDSSSLQLEHDENQNEDQSEQAKSTPTNTLPSFASHSQEKINLHQCTFCGLNFLEDCNVKLHQSNERNRDLKHEQYGKKGIVCQICKYKFSRYTLPKHIDKHHRQRNANRPEDYRIIRSPFHATRDSITPLFQNFTVNRMSVVARQQAQPLPATKLRIQKSNENRWSIATPEIVADNAMASVNTGSASHGTTPASPRGTITDQTSLVDLDEFTDPVNSKNESHEKMVPGCHKNSETSPAYIDGNVEIENSVTARNSPEITEKDVADSNCAASVSRHEKTGENIENSLANPSTYAENLESAVNQEMTTENVISAQSYRQKLDNKLQKTKTLEPDTLLSAKNGLQNNNHTEKVSDGDCNVKEIQSASNSATNNMESSTTRPNSQEGNEIDRRSIVTMKNVNRNCEFSENVMVIVRSSFFPSTGDGVDQLGATDDIDEKNITIDNEYGVNDVKQNDNISETEFKTDITNNIDDIKQEEDNMSSNAESADSKENRLVAEHHNNTESIASCLNALHDEDSQGTLLLVSDTDDADNVDQPRQSAKRSSAMIRARNTKDNMHVEIEMESNKTDAVTENLNFSAVSFRVNKNSVAHCSNTGLLNIESGINSTPKESRGDSFTQSRSSLVSIQNNDLNTSQTTENEVSNSNISRNSFVDGIESPELEFNDTYDFEQFKTQISALSYNIVPQKIDTFDYSSMAECDSVNRCNSMMTDSNEERNDESLQDASLQVSETNVSKTGIDEIVKENNNVTEENQSNKNRKTVLNTETYISSCESDQQDTVRDSFELTIPDNDEEHSSHIHDKNNTIPIDSNVADQIIDKPEREIDSNNADNKVESTEFEKTFHNPKDVKKEQFNFATLNTQGYINKIDPQNLPFQIIIDDDDDDIIVDTEPHRGDGEETQIDRGEENSGSIAVDNVVVESTKEQNDNIPINTKTMKEDQRNMKENRSSQDQAISNKHSEMIDERNRESNFRTNMNDNELLQVNLTVTLESQIVTDVRINDKERITSVSDCDGELYTESTAYNTEEHVNTPISKDKTKGKTKLNSLDNNEGLESEYTKKESKRFENKAQDSNNTTEEIPFLSTNGGNSLIEQSVIVISDDEDDIMDVIELKGHTDIIL